jgi:MFS family permease
MVDNAASRFWIELKNVNAGPQLGTSSSAHRRRETLILAIKINIYGLGLMAFWNTLNTLILPMRVDATSPASLRGTALGLVSLIGIGTAALVQPIAGRISDYSNLPDRRRPFILAGTLLGLIFLSIFGWAPQFSILLLGYVLLQISVNIAQAAFQALIPDHVPMQDRGLASGVKNALTVVGAAIGLLGVRALQALGAPVGVWLAYLGFVLTATAVATWLWVPPSPRNAGATDKGLAAALDLRSLYLSSKAILRKHVAFRYAVFAQFFFLLGTYPAQRFLLYFLRDRFGHDAISKASIGLTIAIGVAALSAAAAGLVSDHIGRIPVLVASVVTGTIGIVGLGFAEALPLVATAGCLVAIAVGAFQAANWALMSDDLPTNQGATAFGIANIATAGAGALAGLFGPLVDLLHSVIPGGTWQVTFGLAGLVALASLLPIRRVPSRSRRAQCA